MDGVCTHIATFMITAIIQVHKSVKILSCMYMRINVMNYFLKNKNNKKLNEIKN